MSTLGSRIKEIRQQNSLTQQQFADRISVSRPFISRIESDKEKPSDTLIKLIALEFDISYEWITRGTGKMRMDTNKLDYFERTHTENFHEGALFHIEYLKKYLTAEQPSIVDSLLSGIFSSLEFLLQQYGDDKNMCYLILESATDVFMSFADAIRDIDGLNENDPAYLNKVFYSLRTANNEMSNKLQSIGKLYEEKSK